MDPFAEASDVAAIWRPLTDAEVSVATARIDQASRLVRRKVREITGTTLDALITAGTLTVDDVKDVVTEMVLRTFTLGAYVKQQSVSVDDGSTSNTIDSSVSGKGGIYLLDDELSALVGSVGRLNSGAFTIVPGDPVWT